MRKMAKIVKFGLLPVLALGWLSGDKSCALEKSKALDADSEIERKLRATILPSVHFEEATLEEAVEFFRSQSIEHDPDKGGEGALGVQFVLREDAKNGDGVIDMKLSNMPLMEALRYVTEISGASFRFDSYAVIIGKDVENELMTRKFRVPHSFGLVKEEVTDPFAVSPPPVPFRRANGGELFGRMGVTFPEGASSSYNRETSTLIVRNTESNLELVEDYIWKLFEKEPKSVQVVLELYEVSEELGREMMVKEEDWRRSSNRLGGLEFDARSELERLNDGGKATLLWAPGLVTKSGQRAKFELGRQIEFVSQYSVGKDGRDLPVWSKVYSGTSMECDPVVAADGVGVEVNFAFEIGLGDPALIKRKIVGPASGIEREVESVAIISQKLVTSVALYSGETKLIGSVPGNDEKTTVLAFLTVTVALP